MLTTYPTHAATRAPAFFASPDGGFHRSDKARDVSFSPPQNNLAARLPSGWLSFFRLRPVPGQLQREELK
jgi:hypothetical protein